MPTRLLLIALLLLSTLAWAWVTRGAFDSRGRRSRTSDSPPPAGQAGGTNEQDSSAGAPRTALRVELEPGADGLCLLAGQAAGRATLLVQSGRRLQLHDAAAAETAPPGTWMLPADCYVWGMDGAAGGARLLGLGPSQITGMEVQRARPDSMRSASLAPAGSLFRGMPSRPPLQREFMTPTESGLHFIAPDLQQLRWMVWAPDQEQAALLCRLPTSALAEQVLGYGLADSMSGRLTVPFFKLGPGVDGPELLFRRGDRLLRAGQDGTELDLGRAPRGGDREILGFDHAVPPLSQDWEGDGHLDVLFTVPAEGTLLAYGSQRREAAALDAEGDRGPDQVLKVSGWVLHRWLLDADGDGRDDLFLLESPQLNFLGQLGVLRGAPMIASLTLRRQAEDGSFAPRPTWSHTFELPVVLSLLRKERRIHFPRPVAPLLDPELGLLLLLPSEDGPVLARSGQDGGLEILRELPELPGGSVIQDAFEPLFAQLDGVGGTDLAWIEQPSAPGLPRVVIHRLP